MCKHLEDSVFLLMGVPRLLIMDNGRQCTSRQLTKLLEQYDVKVQFTPFYHPQANHTERTNREIKKILRCYVSDNHKNWGGFVAKVACAIRTSRHESSGHTPFFVNFGREMCLSGLNQCSEDGSSEADSLEKLSRKQEGMRRLFEEVQARLRKAREIQSRFYNLRRRPLQLRTGDKVWRRNFRPSSEAQSYMASLGPKFVGPFVIKGKVGYNIYILADSEGRTVGRYHVKDLKVAHEENDSDVSDESNVT